MSGAFQLTRVRDLAPDTILHNGNIVTMDPDQPRAQAVAIKDGIIVAVGPDAPVRALAGPRTAQRDLGGKTVIPGINDCHNHMMTTGTNLARLQLYDARSIAEIQQAVATAAAEAEPGAWIIGRGWNEALLAEGRMPNRRDLDAAAPRHPVVLERTWNRLAANSLALARAGIDRHTPDPAPGARFGGRIERDADGEPNGILSDRARRLLLDLLPQPTVAERERSLRLACAEYNRLGITSVTDPGVLPDWLAAYHNLRRGGDLSVRAALCLAAWGSSPEPKPADLCAWIDGFGATTGFGDDMLRLDAVKLMPDGGVGDRSAYMYAPYLGTPDNYGQEIVPEAEVHERVRWCHERGWTVDIHVCGDRAQDIAVRAFADTYRARSAANIRHRIHHGYFPTREALALMREYRIGAVVTIPFLYSAMGSYIATVGEARVAEMMPLRTYLDAGLPVACASDTPVAPYNPFAGIYTCVTRTSQQGQMLGPDERITREEALRLYTAGGAWTTFEEGTKGTISPGKVADLAVLDRDLLTVPEAEIPDTRPLLTMLGGAIVYEAAPQEGA